jgi:hypothetical protein
MKRLIGGTLLFGLGGIRIGVAMQYTTVDSTGAVIMVAVFVASVLLIYFGIKAIKKTEAAKK